nr:sorting nexin 2B-like isoform X2 [Ipomoea batatas]
MMGSENQGEVHLRAPRVASMESLTLNDEDLTSKSYASYVSAMSTLSNSQHPLLPSIVATPADADPLLFPPVGASNSPQKPYLEPPSYADAVFNPLDQLSSSGEEANGGQSPVGDSDKSVIFPRSPSSSSEHLKVAVSNPQKEVESSNSIVPGGNTFVTYLITTKTNIPEYGGSEFSVRRRFKDVVVLADRLNEAYRGYFIPPRPDKSVVESQVMQKQEFVEQRRVALERYLKRLAAHPVIKKSNELRAFLQVQGKLPVQSTDVASRVLDETPKLPQQFFPDSRNAVQPQDVVQPSRGGRDLLRLFRELKQSVVNDWGGSRPRVEEDDKEFLEKKERLHELEQNLTTASKQAELLVKEQQDMAETMGQLGLAFLKLTKFENERAMLNTQKERAADMKNLATAAVKSSRLYRELNAQTVKHLDVLHEHLGLMLAVHGAFSDRSSALLTVQTLLSELSSLNSKAEKLETTSPKKFGGDKLKIQKLDELRGTIRATEDAKSCAIREYERIKEINRIEMGRLDRERHDNFINMLKGFVISQAAYSEKIGKEWTKVAEETSRYTKASA